MLPSRHRLFTAAFTIHVVPWGLLSCGDIAFRGDVLPPLVVGHLGHEIRAPAGEGGLVHMRRKLHSFI